MIRLEGVHVIRYIIEVMPILGIAPRLLPYESNVLTVILYRLMLPLGIEPRFFGYQPNVLPLYYGGEW